MLLSAAIRTPVSAHCPRRAGAFTLIELLIVIGLIAVLMGLTLPSLQGLFGVAGRRGGSSVLGGALEQARLAAIQNGTKAYLAFPGGMDSSEASVSSFIVFRGPREGETVSFVPLSRWMRLPTGVFVDPDSIQSAVNTNMSVSGIPRLNATNVSSVKAIEFDRFGKVTGDPNQLRELRVGEGVFSGSSVTFKPSANDFYRLTVYPMTGRIKVTDGMKP